VNYKILPFLLLLFVFSCKDDRQKVENKPTPVSIPRVDADSAFSFIEKQLSFGVRVPGTQGHAMTKEWIVSKMKSYGATVEIQEFKASFLDKKDIPSYNIIAKINPNQEKRIMFFAHWDTRLIAEKDANENMKNKPIPGAVDGASGVAGLIEIARLIHNSPINLGIDFVFFDAEDQGDDDGNWCIGSQHWAKAYKSDIKPEFGILLDLIGAKNATYGMEGYSMQAAPDLVKKIWALAGGMGKSNLFQNYDGGGIMDDHYYVNTIARIPTIDIIETTQTGRFGDYHHTHDDNIEAIDKTNLASVIQVVTAVAYKVSDGTF
jgi:Zn-dependent M28 family amino/carboxypeptidase